MLAKLKSYEQLESSLRGFIDRILGNQEKEQIEELSSPSKEELLFLKQILSFMKTAPSTGKKSFIRVLNPDAVSILYGTILVLKAHIHQKEGIKYFDDCLNRLLDKQKPSPAQSVIFLSALNRFFNILFQDKDSNKGIVLGEQAFCTNATMLQDLCPIIKIAYQLEAQACTLIHQQYQVAEHEQPEGIALPILSFPPMTTQFNFETMKAGLTRVINLEIGHKGVQTLEELRVKYSIRARQLLMLQATEVALSSLQSSEEEKGLILAGVMLLIREEIVGNKVHFTCEKSTSKVHEGLTQLLISAPQKEGTLYLRPHEEIQLLIEVAYSFIHYMTTEPVNQFGKINFKKHHLYSKIDGIKVVDVLNQLQELKKLARIEILDRCLIEKIPTLNKNSSWVPALPSLAFPNKWPFSIWSAEDKAEKKEEPTETKEEPKETDELVILTPRGSSQRET